MSTEDESTAAHELGHALAMREAGLLIGRIDVYQFFGGGRCHLLSQYVTDEQYGGYLVGMAAGYVAEDSWRAQRGMSGASWSAAAWDFSVINANRGAIMTEGEAMNRAATLLFACWDELETLVPVLAEAGRMNGADL
jgi:hypothetical protein